MFFDDGMVEPTLAKPYREYYSAVKRKKWSLHAAAWTGLKGSVQSVDLERSHAV